MESIDKLIDCKANFIKDIPAKNLGPGDMMFFYDSKKPIIKMVESIHPYNARLRPGVNNTIMISYYDHEDSDNIAIERNVSIIGN